jgi:hypothetical protein
LVVASSTKERRDVNHERESCQPDEDSAGCRRRPGGNRVGSRGLRNQPEALAGHLDHHHDYYGNYYRNNPTSHADRKRDQSNRRQLILATSDSATRADGTTWHSPSSRRVATRTGTFIMSSNRIRPRLIGLAGGAALVVMGAVTAGCGTSANQGPSTTTTTTTTTTTSSPSSTPAPTEKSVSPTGGNLFTPRVKAPAAPAVPPGQHPGINGIP